MAHRNPVIVAAQRRTSLAILEAQERALEKRREMGLVDEQRYTQRKADIAERKVKAREPA